MRKSLTWKDWLGKLFGASPKDSELQKTRQQARDSLLHELELISRIAKKEEHGRNH